MLVVRSTDERSRFAPVKFVIAVAIALAACSASSRSDEASSSLPSSMAERMSNAVACMRSKGLDAVTNDGGVILRTAPPKGLPVEDIMNACLHETGADEQRPALTDAQLNAVFEHWNKMADCLSKLGYPPAPAPSLDTFISDYRSGNVWDPWGNVPADAFAIATSKCPQAVPGVSG